MGNENGTWIMYNEKPAESGKAIVQHITELYPIAGTKAIRKLLGGNIC